MNENQRAELEHLLSLDADELYRRLVPEGTLTPYSKEGATARGRDILRRLLPEIRERVCPRYNSRRDAASNMVDLGALVLMALAGAPMIVNVPAIPLSALIVKIGLNQLCHDYKTDEAG